MANRSNLDSPVKLESAIEFHDLNGWLIKESKVIDKAYFQIIEIIIDNHDEFIKWPQSDVSILLWDGVTRETKYHQYTPLIKERAKKENIILDSRANGPARAAYEFAKGQRPNRYGSKNGWYCNHLYSGKFPYYNRNDTLHAVKEGKHFTQSAGLVVLHPIANAVFDEYPQFAWYLRATSVIKYGYDPDKINSESDEYGFHDNAKYTIIQRKVLTTGST